MPEARPSTVFVIGAGASIPYGFPSGQDLRHEMVGKTLKPGDPRHGILMEMDFTYDEVEKFRIALARSWASSIDFFLATRQEYLDVGKAAIALTIAFYERDNELFFAPPSTDWFRYLWRHIRTEEPEDFPKESIGFVTFNYDRSLEHSLYEGIRHAYGSGDNTNSLMPEIVHVYGSLGEYIPSVLAGPSVAQFAFRAERCYRQYATPNTPETTRGSMNSIKIISEKNDDSEYVVRARTLIGGAKHLVFLGFGYDEDNCHLLRLGHVGSIGPEVRLLGTGFGLTGTETNSIRGRFPLSSSGPRLQLTDPGTDCLGFLRRYAPDILPTRRRLPA